MKRNRRTFSSKFKAKVALEAVTNQSTAAQICSKYDVTASQISQWKNEVLKNSSLLFENKKHSIFTDIEKEKAPLFEEIGRLKVELDWLKKKSLQIQLMRK